MPGESLASHIEGAAPGAPLRKAALLLHSMTESDRLWMLSQVPGPQRGRLDALLAELEALGFPADEALLRASLQVTPDHSNNGAAAEGGPRSDLARWSAQDAMQVLEGEPDRLVAIALSAGPWPWRAEFLHRLGSTRSATLERLEDEGPVPPAPLVDAVLDGMRSRKRIAGSPATTGASPAGARGALA